MDMRHVFGMVIILALGYWLGRKYPGALAGIPVLGA